MYGKLVGKRKIQGRKTALFQIHKISEAGWDWTDVAGLSEDRKGLEKQGGYATSVELGMTEETQVCLERERGKSVEEQQGMSGFGMQARGVWYDL